MSPVENRIIHVSALLFNHIVLEHGVLEPMAHLVSVCLPVWNGAKFIESAISSVLIQTHNDIELIVIDDCSSDDTAAIVRRLAAKDKRIRFYQNEFRLGLFENYNKCMSLAKGKYIKPFAQDDILDSRIIEKLVKLIQSDSNTALACAAREWIDSDGVLLKDKYLMIPSVSDIFPDGQKVSRAKVLQCSVFPITNLIGEPAAVLFPRALGGSGFDTRYKHLGDLEYWLRLLESGSLVCTSEKLCSIREHSKRQSVENMQSLAIATDYVQFAKAISSSVSAIGYSAESFFRSAIIELSQHLDHTIKDEKQISVFKNFAQENPLYELAFHSLLLIANSKQEIVHPGMDRRVELNERHIARMERYLQQLLIAPGW
ncbi:MAG TPA: glycosyltransferase family 2 protein, partial [Candidatus Melainabacteria bacterium]|nr:glycosyltransferase family 2 protein [Candidatus Melainabacteria bacterium]